MSETHDIYDEICAFEADIRGLQKELHALQANALWLASLDEEESKAEIERVAGHLWHLRFDVKRAWGKVAHEELVLRTWINEMKSRMNTQETS